MTEFANGPWAISSRISYSYSTKLIKTYRRSFQNHRSSQPNRLIIDIPYQSENVPTKENIEIFIARKKELNAFCFVFFSFPYAAAVHIMNNELWNFSVHLSISVTSSHLCIVALLLYFFSVKSSEDIGEIFYYMLGTYIRCTWDYITYNANCNVKRFLFLPFFARSVFIFYGKKEEVVWP